MIADHLQEKKGLFYIVLNCKDENGKRKPKWIPTGLAVKGNKKKAEGLLLEARQNFELAANAQAEEELIISAHIPEEEKAEDNDQILFADFMLDWLEIVRPSIELTNYISYSNSVKGRIVPYFKEKGITFRIFTNMPIPNGR